MRRGRSNWIDHSERRNAFARKVANALSHAPGVMRADANTNTIHVSAADGEYTIIVARRLTKRNRSHGDGEVTRHA